MRDLLFFFQIQWGVCHLRALLHRTRMIRFLHWSYWPSNAKTKKAHEELRRANRRTARQILEGKC
ncbi:MAG: hypothetical protein PHV93_01035 [Candidatus Pacebacteria bacterium]|nr:hypothetical protein [Candidatus Paceibacterota bacterium]